MITQEDRDKSLETRKEKMNRKQLRFIKAFAEMYACNISATCKALNVNRRLYYKWIDEQPSFREAIEDAQESLVDLAETKLQQNIMEGKEASIFFFLKTKGKSRGYIETIEQRFSSILLRSL